MDHPRAPLIVVILSLLCMATGGYLVYSSQGVDQKVVAAHSGVN